MNRFSLPERLAFVDLETTGATGTHDRITEIGIVSVGPEGVSEWNSLVNPQVPISSFIEQLTGISNRMVAGAPVFAELADEVRERLAGHLFIAHNARFDYGFIKGEFARLGQGFRAPVLCTVKLSRKLYPEHYKHNLDALISRHALTVSDRHRALGDARLIHQFWTLHRGEAMERLQAHVSELLAQSLLPPHLETKLSEDLPEGRGVYLFFGADDVLLHVGRGKTLKRQVLKYFSADKPSSAKAALAKQVERIRCFATEDETDSLLIESHWRKQLGNRVEELAA
jgi:DNA polymerase-3 subunit epsilon